MTTVEDWSVWADGLTREGAGFFIAAKASKPWSAGMEWLAQENDQGGWRVVARRVTPLPEFKGRLLHK